MSVAFNTIVAFVIPLANTIDGQTYLRAVNARKLSFLKLPRRKVFLSKYTEVNEPVVY
jgi:hypothetical protein